MKLPLWKRHTLYFVLASVLIVLVSIYMRPLRSPWHPFIAGDGLGYYAYLPAKFIHNDPNLDFKWFNRVHNANYAYSAFDNPEDNLLVQYDNKRVNKYYTGMSFVLFPFFVAGHIYAKLFHYTPDGFSRPYQVFIGIGSLFYLLLGLFLLRALLYKLFHSKWIATLVPLLYFFGTHLFTYSIFANTLSHTYSFTFTAGFLYFAVLFFREPGHKTRSLFLMLAFLVIGACIRPLNLLLVLTLPAFMPKSFSIRKTVFEKINVLHLLILLVLLAAAAWQLHISYIQTGSLLAYNYSGETFRFGDARFFDALFSYHQGLIIYVPLIALSLLGFLFFERKAALLLVFYFLGILFLYSAWWYWPITKRAMIDVYPISAIGLAALLNSSRNKAYKTSFIGISFLAMFYFQLKAYQTRLGILDEFLTYKELFWRHFFRLEKATIYAVPPQSIISVQSQTQNFEAIPDGCKLSADKSSEGTSSLLLDKEAYICKVGTYSFPALYAKPEYRKLKIALDIFPTADSSQAQVFIKFMGKNNRELVMVPFYLNEDNLLAGKWDHKEFGYDLVDRRTLNADSVQSIELYVWNIKGDKPIYVDAVKTDFLLTNTYFETVK